MAVELHQVVRRGDQTPFGEGGGTAWALETADLAVELDLREHRLDRRFSVLVDRVAVLASEDPSHKCIHACSSAARRFELWITNPAAPPARPTLDVDVVVEVAARTAFHEFEAKLRARGFQNYWLRRRRPTRESGELLR
ncbi:MAG: hypothetical protein ABI323_10350 [Solirubrobacteraceae bacterium]